MRKSTFKKWQYINRYAHRNKNEFGLFPITTSTYYVEKVILPNMKMKINTLRRKHSIPS